MTTEAQKAANQRNAKYSTGPMSHKGKAASSANARKHGLTTYPDQASVLGWYKVVLNDLDATPNPFDRSTRLRTAYWLAEAEARLERVRHAEEVLQLEIQSADQYDPADYDFSEEVLKPLNSDTRFVLRLLRQVGKGRREAQQKEMRIIARYRREAEAGRHKALKRWIAACRIAKRNPETNPITP